jgi:short-subunit dehydrogenase
LVTGASKGIGAALAERYAREGAALTLVARSGAKLEALAESLRQRHQARVTVLPADLADPGIDLEALLADAEARLGPVDVLVNNAGRMIVGPAEGTPDPDVRAIVELDLVAPMRLALAAAPGMLARRSGTIVNVASSAAFSWFPGMVYYNAVKAGMGAWSESLRAEWRGTGVNVVSVYPGPVRTDLAEASIEAYGFLARLMPIGTVEGLASAIVRAVRWRSRLVLYPYLYRPFPWIAVLVRRFTDVLVPRPSPGDSARR